MSRALPFNVPSVPTPNPQNISERFQRAYGHAPAVIARAPGRVEFIGNHTDYNGGAVLGGAIDRSVWVAAAANPSGRLRLARAGSPTVVELSGAAAAKITGPDSWANYPLGVWRSLSDFQQPRPPAFDLWVDSDLPAGAGLGSSAALELAVALALRGLAGAPPIAPALLAAIGRHAENNYVGVPCGILDQGTSAFGRAGHLVHIDCRGPAYTLVPLPESARCWVFNTREKHALIDGLYAARQRECMEAAAALGVSYLADLTPAGLEQRKSRLAPVLERRARHVVLEQARVQDTVAALQRGDLAAIGPMLTASHRGSQHLFENSTPALDHLVDLLTAHREVLGARLTGGGFGGAVLALTDETFSEQAAAEIGRRYAGLGHPEPDVLQLQSADGAQIIPPA